MPKKIKKINRFWSNFFFNIFSVYQAHAFEAGMKKYSQDKCEKQIHPL